MGEGILRRVEEEGDLGAAEDDPFRAVLNQASSPSDPLFNER